MTGNENIPIDLGIDQKGIEYGREVIRAALGKTNITYYRIIPNKNGVIIETDKSYKSEVFRAVKSALLEATNSNNGKYDREKADALRSSIAAPSFYIRSDHETHTLPKKD